MLMAQNDPLWARISQFSLDDPTASFKFSDRLARENSWSLAYTYQVIEEYKRFVYLAMTAGHPVTPSVDVDQVWHLHLTYTQSYWELFCGEVLQRPFHHGPTKGGKQEGAKFNDWYSRTLASYETAFGHAPPETIWPSAEVRFSRRARIRQVSDQTHWVIPKPQLRPQQVVWSLLLLLLVGLVGWIAINNAPFTNLLSTSSATAQEDYILSQYEATFAPVRNSDGEIADVHTALRIVYEVNSGTKADGFKFVGTQPIKDVTVVDGNGNPLVFQVEEMDETRISWSFPPVSNGQQIVVVRFTIIDGLEGSLEQNQFYAEWVKNWQVPVNNVTYRFVLPTGYQQQAWSASPQGQFITYEERPTIEIKQNQLTNTPLEIQFEPGIVDNQSLFSAFNIGDIFFIVFFLFLGWKVIAFLLGKRSSNGSSDYLDNSSGCSTDSGCGGCGG